MFVGELNDLARSGPRAKPVRLEGEASGKQKSACPPGLMAMAGRADVYVNGLIDYEEFVTATVHMNKMDREEHLYTTFQFFDKDYSGQAEQQNQQITYITRDELEQALKEKGMYDAKEIKEIIS
ncbi:hypothetical protein ZWY2020_053455 [Hordeum vulgare]|nr:hypothetical protein ZWY2020_053455 [Hordeum vulgare]